MQIAVLLTTYNRKQKTVTCLEHVFNQQLPVGVEISVYQTDDASSDGTAEAVRQQFPQVILLNGTGQLFWAGGMRYTWSEALKKDYTNPVVNVSLV
ncbi:MAG: glycosyltransferase, partial [Sphingobacteriaceae bacterium]